MRVCAFKNCQHSTEPWAILHRFPTDSALRRKWLKAIDRKGFRPKKSSRVCRAHFAYDSYVTGTNRLRFGSVPGAIDASRESTPQPSRHAAKTKCLTSVSDNRIADDETAVSKGVDDSPAINEGTGHKRVRLYTESVSTRSNSENEPPENTFRNSPISKSSIIPPDIAELIRKAYPKRLRRAHTTGSEVRIMPLPTNEDVLRRKLSMCRLKLSRRDETIERLKKQIAECNPMPQDANDSR